jgi:hypothetical protein
MRVLVKLLFTLAAFGLAACDGGSSPAETTAQLPPPQVMSIMLYPDSIQLKGYSLSDIGQIQIEDEGFSVVLNPDPHDGSLSAPLDRSLGVAAGKTYQVTLLGSDGDQVGIYSVICSGD